MTITRTGDRHPGAAGAMVNDGGELEVRGGCN
jgi:hypothetical protein